MIKITVCYLSLGSAEILGIGVGVAPNNVSSSADFLAAPDAPLLCSPIGFAIFYFVQNLFF